MLIKELIDRDIIALEENEDLSRAIHIFLKTERNCIPIINQNKEPVGILTPSLLVQALVTGCSLSTPVVNIMQKETLMIFFEDTSLQNLSQVSLDKVIVIDHHGKMVGMLSQCHLIWWLYDRLQKAREAIEAMEELNSVIESSYDGIIILDEEKILRVNRSFERISGLKASELVGVRVDELDKKVHVCLESIRTVFYSVLKERKPCTVLRKVNNNDVYVTGSPVLDRMNRRRVVRVILNVRDVTELQSLREKIKSVERLTARYERELEELRARLHIQSELVFASQEMKKLMEFVTRVARADSTVLIQGESGVGKEVIARLIHQLSQRANKPFIQINCGAIPENLLESELFGYERGAFTGAKKEGKPGLFELANEGTLFLDEIGELPLNLQVKLLRAIQNQEIYRLGGTKPIKLDIRIIAATNKSLQELVQCGAFREDLYYRLSVIPIFIPPLRERKEDILPLSFYFLKKFNEKYNVKKNFSRDVCAVLEAYDWPGNVRELQNVIERLVVLSEGDTIQLEHVPSHLFSRGGRELQKVIKIEGIVPLLHAREYVERELIKRALSYSNSIREAAELLGIDHSTCVRKIQKYGLNPKIKLQSIF